MTQTAGMCAAVCRVDEFIYEIVNACQLRPGIWICNQLCSIDYMLDVNKHNKTNKTASYDVFAHKHMLSRCNIFLQNCNTGQGKNH